MDEESWHCFFEDFDGNVLVSVEGWEDPETAAHWGQRIIDNPEMFTLFDPDGVEVPATEIDPDASFNVEQHVAEEL